MPKYLLHSSLNGHPLKHYLNYYRRVINKKQFCVYKIDWQRFWRVSKLDRLHKIINETRVTSKFLSKYSDSSLGGTRMFTINVWTGKRKINCNFMMRKSYECKQHKRLSLNKNMYSIILETWSLKVLYTVFHYSTYSTVVIQWAS